MHFLNSNYPHEGGECKKKVSINKDNDSVRSAAILWVDKNRRFFVGKAEPATSEEPLYCVRWSHVSEQSDNMDPKLAENFLKMPMTIEVYCFAFGDIYRHNN